MAAGKNTTNPKWKDERSILYAIVCLPLSICCLHSPILSTTQYVELQAFNRDHFLGRIIVPLAQASSPHGHGFNSQLRHIVCARQQIKIPFAPSWYKLLPKTSQHGAPDEKDGKVSGEVELKISLSTEKPTGGVDGTSVISANCVN